MKGKILTYTDSGLLIALSMQEPIARAAKVFQVLTDTNRAFVSSDALRLEVLPKPTHFGEKLSIELIESFFEFCAVHVAFDAKLYRAAFAEACQTGLSAMDAVHLVSAAKAGVDEFITTEKRTKALYKTNLIRVVHLDSL